MTTRALIKQADAEIARSERLLKVAEAATRLNVSHKTIRKYIDAGVLRAIRLPSQQFRIPESSVEALLT